MVYQGIETKQTKTLLSNKELDQLQESLFSTWQTVVVIILKEQKGGGKHINRGWFLDLRLSPHVVGALSAFWCSGPTLYVVFISLYHLYLSISLFLSISFLFLRIICISLYPAYLFVSSLSLCIVSIFFSLYIVVISQDHWYLSISCLCLYIVVISLYRVHLFVSCLSNYIVWMPSPSSCLCRLYIYSTLPNSHIPPPWIDLQGITWSLEKRLSWEEKRHLITWEETKPLHHLRRDSIREHASL